MNCAGTTGNGILLREVTVRPVLRVEERRRWDALVAEHHYLPFRGLFGKALRHVAVFEGQWLALLGWHAGAFKVGVRDEWIGWSAQRQFRRLHLIANNARFVVLEAGRIPNLASRVLGLSLRRVAGDMEAIHGYPVLLAETFVDPSRFAGTCYRAANWQRLGMTQGYSRESGGRARWRRNGRPKQVYVYPLRTDAREALCGEKEPAAWQLGDKREPMAAPALRSLAEFLGEIPDFRKARGQRYPLSCYLAIAIAARLAGYRGVTAMGEFAALLDQDQLRAVGAFWSPSRKRYTAPAISTLRYILTSLPPETLDRVLQEWTAQHLGEGTPVAMDGKEVRGASKALPEDQRRMLVAAVEHGSGLVLGQVQVGDATNEITAVRELAEILDLRNRTVTLDAMHVQQETARCLIDDCQANYLVTAVKDNQKTLLEDLQDIDWSTARTGQEDWQKAHGRIEQRRCAVVDVSGPEWDGYVDLYGRRQALRVERERHVVSRNTSSTETAWCLTSLSPQEAGPEQLLALTRQHWEIENRLHYVRDFTYDEDRCRARTRHLPRNLASLTNAAISIVRRSCFPFMPQANRYFAARPQAALDAILTSTPN